MKSEKAIEVLRDELDHTRLHLEDINKAPEFYEELGNYCEAVEMAITALEILHDDWLDFKNMIDKRPQGEWKRHDEWRNGEYIGGFYHVNCPVEDGYYSKWEYNYCPNCGADMRKGDNNG